jgi:hypothetical protein
MGHLGSSTDQCLGVGLILGCPLLEDEREQDDNYDAQYRNPEGRKVVLVLTGRAPYMDQHHLSPQIGGYSTGFLAPLL